MASEECDAMKIADDTSPERNINIVTQFRIPNTAIGEVIRKSRSVDGESRLDCVETVQFDETELTEGPAERTGRDMELVDSQDVVPRKHITFYIDPIHRKSELSVPLHEAPDLSMVCVSELDDRSTERIMLVVGRTDPFLVDDNDCRMDEE